MPEGSFLCCLLPELLITIVFVVNIAMDVHKRPAIESERIARYDMLSYLVLAGAYGTLSYLIYYQPNVHSGQPVPWGDMAFCVSSPIILAAVFYAYARYMIHVYAPRP